MKFTEFVKRYPNYDQNRFGQDSNGNVTFLFNGSYYDPFNSDGTLKKSLYQFPSFEGHHYTPENINDFLGSKFPKGLTLSNKKYSIPAVDLSSKPDDIKKLLSSLEVYVTPSQKISVKINDVFQLTPPSFSDISGYTAWMRAPNLKYWSQQLNFAVWCATSGCGIGYDLLKPDTQVASVLRFHVLITVRRILSSLQVPQPWDNNFVWDGTRYNNGVYQRLCNEFGVKNPDFRFKGIGTDSDKFSFYYRSPSNDKLTAYYQSTHEDRSQYNWFVPQLGEGLTKAGLSRLNQSIEAYVYCVLGAQVNTRSAIVGSDGASQETQQEFAKLFESSVVERDISKSIQRYQFAVQQAKVRLNLAISPGTWLLPSNLVINTRSVVGYNNKLEKATKDMVFGINNINNEMIKTSTGSMGGSGINLPHKTSDIKPKPVDPKPDVNTNHVVVTESTSRHENNLAAVTLVATGLAWYMFR